MRRNHALALSFACTLATTAACSVSPSDELDVETEEAALVAASAEGFDLDFVKNVGEMAASGAKFIGTRIMLTFGWTLSAAERIECNGLNMQTETVTVDGCSFTVQNRDCQSGWDEEIDEYVCVCERWVTGQSGNCGGGR